MKFQSSVSERQEVEQRSRLPDLTPRKDYGVRIAGPAAQDVDAALLERWNLGRKRGDLYSEHTTEFPMLPEADGTGSVQLQVQVTSPEPLGERSILESLQKAVMRAESLIIIEDQYFRAPLIDELIAERLKSTPSLHVVVVTVDVGPNDGGKKWTLIADETLRAAAPDRYHLFQLRAFDAVWGPVVGVDEEGPAHALDQAIDVHSKLLIVDDQYLNVGSANKNNRGLLYEGEMNVAVVDSEWVRDARRRVLETFVGAGHPLTAESDGATLFQGLKTVAAQNDAVRDWWSLNVADIQSEEELASSLAEHLPTGRIYSLVLQAGYLLEVGPDTY